jgi:hypothetical protein
MEDISNRQNSTTVARQRLQVGFHATLSARLVQATRRTSRFRSWRLRIGSGIITQGRSRIQIEDGGTLVIARNPTFPSFTLGDILA